MDGGPVRLLYWPVKTVGGDLCHRNGSTLLAAPIGEGLNTIVDLGTTFTSPTVYISFATLWAMDRCAQTTGTPLRNHIMAVKSDEITTVCGGRDIPQMGIHAVGQLNYADLNSPVPLSAYSCMQRCSWGMEHAEIEYWKTACPTVYDDFAPALAFPTGVYNLQPEWKSCGHDIFNHFNFLFDPPSALGSVAQLTQNTSPSATSKTTVKPAATPQAIPKPTEVQNPPQTSVTTSPATPHLEDPGSPSTALLPSVVSASKESQEVTTQAAVLTLSGARSGLSQEGSPDPFLRSPIATIGGITVIADPTESNVLNLGSIKLTSGMQTTIDNIVISVGRGNVVIGGVSIHFPTLTTVSNQPSTPLSIAVLTLGSQIITTAQGRDGKVTLVDDVVIESGLPAAEISGHTFSLGSNGVIVDGVVTGFSAVSSGAVAIGGTKEIMTDSKTGVFEASSETSARKSDITGSRSHTSGRPEESLSTSRKSGVGRLGASVLPTFILLAVGTLMLV